MVAQCCDSGETRPQLRNRRLIASGCTHLSALTWPSVSCPFLSCFHAPPPSFILPTWGHRKTPLSLSLALSSPRKDPWVPAPVWVDRGGGCFHTHEDQYGAWLPCFGLACSPDYFSLIERKECEECRGDRWRRAAAPSGSGSGILSSGWELCRWPLSPTKCLSFLVPAPQIPRHPPHHGESSSSNLDPSLRSSGFLLPPFFARRISLLCQQATISPLSGSLP